MCFAEDKGTQSPAQGNGAATSERAEAKVQKVYTIKDGDYKFIAYGVKWHDADIIVSDTLAKSDFKVGDTIRFLVLKSRDEKSKPSSYSTIHFELFNPPVPQWLPMPNPAPATPQPQT
jgi:hypothetical protein